MDSIVRFRLKEKDGKLFLVIHDPKFHSISQTQISPTSSDEAGRHDHRLQTLFLCPLARLDKDKRQYKPYSFFPLTSSHVYVRSTTRTQQDESSVDNEHYVLPLFWCNNKNIDFYCFCSACGGLIVGTDYYFCELDKLTYHKECVESPPKIKHPYHPEHSLQLYFNCLSNLECLYCGRIINNMTYCCFICNVFMHSICAMQPIPFLIEQPKRHNHSLSFFTRQTPLICNVCGLLEKNHPTYVCVRCNFVAHKDCMCSPRIIKISRHHHRISYISSLQSNEWLCGICRQIIDHDYGAYTCDKCSGYVVHSRCALGEDVWDGEELESVPEKDYTIQDAKPFDMISEGVILHFLHNHHLLLEVNILYDEKNLCQACELPIYEDNFYFCMNCNFILHESCANAPRMIQHALHPHPLTLKATSGYRISGFNCNACGCFCDGFGYQCRIRDCTFDLDVRCASISEPFVYKGHEHALFLALNPTKKLEPICQVCKNKCIRQPLNCIKCDFIVCFKCVTLPYKVRYRHDKHFLTVLWGEKVCEEDWCDICECNLKDTSTKVFYWCNECCTILHIRCLFGRNPYLNPNHRYKKFLEEDSDN